MIKNEPSEEMKNEALKNPGGWVYKIDGKYSDDEPIPPEAIVGAWKVDEYGQIVGEFLPNPNYKPRRKA